MTKTNKLDPLEENKVGGSGGKRRTASSKKKKPVARTPPPHDPPPDPPAGRDDTPKTIPEPPPLPPAEPEKPKQKPVPMVAEKPVPPSNLPESASGTYEVLEETKVSIRGHITAMPKGTVIHLAHYGRQVMANMVKQGLKLKGLD